MQQQFPTEAGVRLALQNVLDPEIGENILDLGLIKSIELTPRSVHVVLIPTSATCPMGDLLLQDSTDAVRSACPEDVAVSVAFDWQASWDPQRMSPHLQARFGW